jgi:hypothetical protein
MAMDAAQLTKLQAYILGQSYMGTLILTSLWYSWEYLRSPAKNLPFFAGYLADWQCIEDPKVPNAVKMSNLPSHIFLSL